jgi:hypothetical protein
MVDVIDETFVVAEPAAVAEALRDPALWERMFPGLELHVFMDRGDAGIRFTVTGRLVGTNEFWVEPWGDGAVVHYYLRADITRRGSATEPITGSPRTLYRRAIRARAQHCALLKTHLNAVKDTLEAGRPPGTARGTPPMVKGAHPPQW